MVLTDPEFLVRLKKMCEMNGWGGKVYFYFLAALRNCEDIESTLEWLQKQSLINKEVQQELLVKLRKQRLQGGTHNEKKPSNSHNQSSKE